MKGYADIGVFAISAIATLLYKYTGESEILLGFASDVAHVRGACILDIEISNEAKHQDICRAALESFTTV